MNSYFINDYNYNRSPVNLNVQLWSVNANIDKSACCKKTIVDLRENNLIDKFFIPDDIIKIIQINYNINSIVSSEINLPVPSLCVEEYSFYSNIIIDTSGNIYEYTDINRESNPMPIKILQLNASKSEILHDVIINTIKNLYVVKEGYNIYSKSDKDHFISLLDLIISFNEFFIYSYGN